MKPEQLTNLKQIIELYNKGVSKEDFSAFQKAVADLLVKINQRSEQLANEIRKAMQMQLDELVSKADNKLAQVKDGKDGKNGLDGQNGKDAVVNEEQIARIASNLAIVEVLKQIPTIEAIEQDLPKLGSSIRDALELLQGQDRLNIDAIDGLKEVLEEIRAVKGKVGSSGGFNNMSINYHIVDDETPVGTIDGNNTTFTIKHAPSPTSSLKVYLNGQRMRITEDYTFSGLTITFNTAPLTGSILLCDYRI